MEDAYHNKRKERKSVCELWGPDRNKAPTDNSTSGTATYLNYDSGVCCAFATVFFFFLRIASAACELLDLFSEFCVLTCL